MSGNGGRCSGCHFLRNRLLRGLGRRRGFLRLGDGLLRLGGLLGGAGLCLLADLYRAHFFGRMLHPA